MGIELVDQQPEGFLDCKLHLVVYSVVYVSEVIFPRSLVELLEERLVHAHQHFSLRITPTKCFFFCGHANNNNLIN